MSLFPLECINIELLCGNSGIRAPVKEIARTQNSVSVRVSEKYGISMRPALVKICQSLQIMTCDTYVYHEEAYPNETILTFQKVG